MAEHGDWRRGRPVTTPPPSQPPSYPRPPRKTSRDWTVEDAVDGGFFVVAALLVVWLGWEVLSGESGLSLLGIVSGIVFWLLLAYVGLPRLQQLLARIYVPDYFIGRAVTDVGLLGDVVNLAADGSAEDVHEAMTRAGWTRADDVTLRSSWGIVISAVLRRSYPAAPVSPLLLFGRQQAFAYEQEVDGNASQRHHVRFWPVPEGWVLPGGFRVDWLAAATYDRAVGLSAFTLQVTHKVDGDVDIERDYVVGTVRYAMPDTRLRVIEDFSTAFTSRNGGGDIVRTDGSLAIVDVDGLSGQHTAPSPGAPRRAPWERRLPPPALLICGAFGLGKALLTLIGAITLALHGGLADTITEVVGMAVGASAVVALWGFTLGRRRWARTLLMAVATVDAVSQLVLLSGAAHPGLLVLATTSLSVLVIVTVSSTSVRRWVAGRA